MVEKYNNISKKLSLELCCYVNTNRYLFTHQTLSSICIYLDVSDMIFSVYLVNLP